MAPGRCIRDGCRKPQATEAVRAAGIVDVYGWPVFHENHCLQHAIECASDRVRRASHYQAQLMALDGQLPIEVQS